MNKYLTVIPGLAFRLMLRAEDLAVYCTMVYLSGVGGSDEDITRALGISRAVYNHARAELERQGLIRLNDGAIEFIDVAERMLGGE